MDWMPIRIMLCFLFLFSINTYALKNQTSDKKIQDVIQFYKAAFNEKNFTQAAKYLGPTYTQHSPRVANGPEGLKAFIASIRDNYPDTHVEIKKAFVDGNYVILLVHFILKPNTRGLAIMDIFRLERDKIVEHWGVSQEIPENAKNSNSMF